MILYVVSSLASGDCDDIRCTKVVRSDTFVPPYLYKVLIALHHLEWSESDGRVRGSKVVADLTLLLIAGWSHHLQPPTLTDMSNASQSMVSAL